MNGARRARNTRSISFLLAFVLVATPLLTALPAVAYAEESAPAAATVTVGSVELPAGSVEDVTRRDAVSSHYRLPGGTMRAIVSAAPVNYRRPDGAWVPIDTTLVTDGAPGSHKSAAAGATARFKGPSESGKPVSVERGDLAVTIDMLGVAEGAHVALGDTARYLGVAPSTDLVYEALADGLKQTVVLASKDAPSSFSFALGIDGGRLLRVPGGWVVMETGEDAPAFSLGAILVTDAKGARCEDATLSVIADGLGGATVTYDVPRAWLDDPARVYPVAVDPTLQVDQDTYIHSVGNTDYHGGDTTIKSGYNVTTGYNYGLLQFDCDSLEDTKITNADFKVYCNTTSAGSAIYLGRNTSSWSESWRYSDGLPAKSWLANKTLSATGWITWAVDGTVQQWADGVGAPWWYGFQLYQPAGDGAFHYKSFYSSEYATTSLRPVLVVDYMVEPVIDISACDKESYEWFREVDRDDDGVSDTPDDLARVGRGGVDLSWPQNTRAAGYDIYQWDGDTYEKVGTTLGSTSTTWTSEGAGIFPTDSEIAGWPVASRNALTRAASPRAMSQQAAVSVAGESGAGVVVTDGTYLYVRGWGSSANPGPTSWKRVGTGYHGTTAGADYGTVGPDFSAKRIYSAFYLDGFLYNGYADTPTTITGVWKDAAEESTETATLTFSDPLLARSTGATLTAASGDVLLTTDGERIYNVAYGIGGSGAMNGYTIRVFDREGQKLFDRTIATTSDQLDGVLSDGDALYLQEWDNTDSAHVTKVRLADFHITNQWPINQASTRVISGTYDVENKCFWLGSLDTGTVRRYLGPGLDLRDDPRPFYEKSTGTQYYGNDFYWFRIVPFNENRLTAVQSDCTPYKPTLDNRTVRVNDQARHTAADLPEVAGHTASAELDSGALTLDATDLSIASWGPDAAISRHYSSETSAASLLHDAPGWRFSFERALEVTSTSVTYVDEAGERDRFVLAGGAYVAPNGSYARLTTETVSGATRYRLIESDRSSSVFDSTGKLLADYDQANNAVTYTRGTGTLAITAANGQAIDISLDASGHVEAATYATADGTRTASYTERTPGVVAVTSFPGEAEEKTVVLTHAGGLLTQAGIEDYAPSGVAATWSAVYTSGKLTSLRLPGYSTRTTRRIDVSCGSSYATVTRFGLVGEKPGEVLQRYTWNPTGTTVTMTDPYESGTASGGTWSYAYNPANEPVLETSPAYTTVSRMMDTRGNTLAEVDEEGHRTTYVFDSLDRCVRETDPRGATTYRSYAASGFENAGPVTVEERQLNATERSRTEYSYNASGTVTQEKQKLDASTWAVTSYADFALSGEAGTTTREDVILEAGCTPVDLTEQSVFDAFGNALSRTDAAGSTTEANAYDLAGRVLGTTDATGTVSYHVYDTVGGETLTYREASDGAWCDRFATDYDADGNALTQTRYLADASGAPLVAGVVTRTFDEMGREIASDDNMVSGRAIMQYDARGNVTVAWAEGSDTASTAAAARTYYDYAGRVWSETAPGQTAATLTTYYQNGLVKRKTNPDASYTEYRYDESGNKTAEITPAGEEETAEATSAYDVGGRVISETDADGATITHSYDLADRETTTQGEGPASSITYNVLGWVLAKSDADGIVTKTDFDETGRAIAEYVKATGVPDKTTTTAYDAMGRTLCTTDPNGSVLAFGYDALGRTVRESHTTTAGVVKDEAYTYDALGRLKASTDLRTAINRTFTYPIGAPGPTRVRLAYGSVTTTVTLAADGLETSRESVIGSAGITRSATATDAAGRETAWTVGAGAYGRTFDAAGRLERWRAPSSIEAMLAYDAAGRKSRSILNGGLGGAIDTTYAYSDAGRLATVKPSGVATSTLAFDPAGNLTTETVGASVTVMTYDGASQRLLNRKVGGSVVATYTFDALGQRVYQGPTANKYQTALSYTGTGRLASFATSAGVAASYSYDAAGQRTGSVVTSSGVTTTTKYTYEGLTLLSLEATAGSSPYTVSYLNDASGRPYAGVYRAGETTPVVFQLVTNDRGDVVELLDESGNRFASYRYDEWGLPTATVTAGTVAVPAATAADIASRQVLRYAGYCYDEHSGMYYCSARTYDPLTRQFLTKDPAKADGEESAYQYCGGDPVGSVDPSGQWSKQVSFVQSIAWYLRQWESLRLVLAGVAMGILFPPAAAAGGVLGVSGKALAKAIAGGLVASILGPLKDWVAHRNSNAIKKWGNPRLVYTAKCTRNAPHTVLYLKIVAKVNGTSQWKRYKRVLYWRGFIWNGGRRYNARWA